jgi:hypothetical protein
MNRDVRLKWKAHMKKKKDKLEIRRRNLSRLIGRRSQITIDDKLLIYKRILRPVWPYGAQLWGAPNQAILILSKEFKIKYSGALLMLRGMYEIPTYIEV